MGAHFSASQSSAARNRSDPTLAKVITPDGQLREYPGSSLTAAVAIADCSTSSSGHSSSFLCDADTFFCDERLRPMSPHDSLLPGHLYFLLPLQMSHYPISGADMGALAVRATAALQAAPVGMRIGKRGIKKNTTHAPGKSGGNCRVAPLLQLEDVIHGEDATHFSCGSTELWRRPPGSSHLKITGTSTSAHRCVRPAGNKRRVSRPLSFRLRLGTIEEEAA